MNDTELFSQDMQLVAAPKTTEFVDSGEPVAAQISEQGQLYAMAEAFFSALPDENLRASMAATFEQAVKQRLSEGQSNEWSIYTFRAFA
jgi:hypothetical protein